ncbi:Uncharacterised protein [Vibrio cholerae]|nr:Uncharacterised protein [Vibrio cholerae]CSC14937.1 Uncharacterised protein [Vibrio cholerae]CSC48651.1 Uncharacterised protein [Vibrio cholerae]
MVNGKKLSTNSASKLPLAITSKAKIGSAFVNWKRLAVKNGITRPPITESSNINHHSMACHTALLGNGGMPLMVA